MFKTMRLRDKMTLWYTALTFVTVAVFACALYLMTAYVLEEMLEREARLSLQQLTAQVEFEHGMLTFENEGPPATGSMYYIMEENGSELASYGKDISLFDRLPLETGIFRTVKNEGAEWLVLDSAPFKVEHFTVRVRVAVSCALNNRVLSTLLWVFWIGVPFATLVALGGGFQIAKRALRPIRQIIHSANIISGGELSERIPEAPARDELGELTDTLNHMLTNVETSFLREKRFASDASHELRTPVTVLRAYTENLLAEAEMTEDQRASLQIMLAECSRMQKIIGQLLTITRGQEGRYPFCMETLALSAVCEGVAETLSDQLSEKRIGLSLNILEQITLVADQSLLTELFLNLVENAIKYGREQGSIRIAADETIDEVHISVQDDGIGIPADALPHIFERFYRVDTARDRSGTGLGLSIVQWIVKVHQGSISVESEPGRGTVFHIRLPVRLTQH